MKPAALKLQSAGELRQKYLDLKKELFNLKFRLAKGELENNMRVRVVRKDIVRVLSAITEKEKGLSK